MPSFTDHLHIRPLAASDEAELRDWYRACVTSLREGRPHFIPRRYEDFVRGILEPVPGESWQVHVALVDGVVRGSAMTWYSTQDNLDSAWFIIDVDPPFRRRGIGRTLLAHAEEQLEPTRRTVLIPSKIPAGQLDSHPYRLWADAVGLTLSTVGTVREMPLPVPAELIDQLDPGPRPGYRIESFVDGIPQHWQDEVGVLKGLVDVESPTGDMEWEASPVTREQYAEQLRRVIEGGGHYVETIAMHQDSGRVAGYTQLDVPQDLSRPVVQMGTLVSSRHRGHGLGLALKVANLRALATLDTTPARITTSNDDENVHMIAINERLGFVPTELDLTFTLHRPTPLVDA